MNKENKPKSGELEWWKGFEELIKRNVNTIKDFTQDTRSITLELKKEVNELKGLITLKTIEIEELKQQISLIQAKLYKNGTQ